MITKASKMNACAFKSKAKFELVKFQIFFCQIFKYNNKTSALQNIMKERDENKIIHVLVAPVRKGYQHLMMNLYIK